MSKSEASRGAFEKSREAMTTWWAERAKLDADINAEQIWDAAVAWSRSQALEEAAQVCDGFDSDCNDEYCIGEKAACELAKSIRALKDQK